VNETQIDLIHSELLQAVLTRSFGARICTRPFGRQVDVFSMKAGLFGRLGELVFVVVT